MTSTHNKRFIFWKSSYVLLLCWLLLFIGVNEESHAQCEDQNQLFPFECGVASGDATQHEVILWTHVDATFPIHVKWFVTLDTDLQHIVASGETATDDSRNYTVKVDVPSLSENTWYYYAFEALGYRSMIGRTHTLAAHPDHFAFAAFSCSNYEAGYFNAYNDAAKNNTIDAVFHLGDYYYEYYNGGFVAERNHQPSHVLYTLDDYRERHSQICRDQDLRELRRQYPWYTIWDDHEFSNDACLTGAPGHDSNVETWEERIAASKKAYFEWMPIREKEDGTIHRLFEAGDLATFYLLDTRIEGRSQQVSSTSELLSDSSRTMLGKNQFNWLKQSLADHQASSWNFLASSVMMTHAVDAFGQPIDSDTWEGYRFERDSLFRFLNQEQITNCVSIAGDYHSSWLSDLSLENYDAENQVGSVGCEIAVCATTSSPHTVGTIETFVENNPHVKWIEQSSNGYLICEITPDQVKTQWRYISSKTNRDYSILEGQAGSIDAGIPFIHLESTSLELPENSAPMAPSALEVISPRKDAQFAGLKNMVMFPNPVLNDLNIQWVGGCGLIQWQIFDMAGRRLASNTYSDGNGLHRFLFDCKSLSSGTYMIHLKNGNDEVLKLFSVLK